MILLCGIPSETPLAMVRAQLDSLSVPYVLFNQRRFAAMALEFELSAGQVTGWLQVEDRSYRLEEFGGVYTRLMDDQRLPELCDAPADAPQRRACRALHDTLIHWCELTPARVVNRTAAMASNGSKPHQTQLIRAHGFVVPETLITNDPDLVRAFH